MDLILDYMPMDCCQATLSNSALSTQDGWRQELAYSAQEDTAEPVRSQQGPLHWNAGPDKDCLHANASDVHDDATCSSRSIKHCKQQHQQHPQQQLAGDQASLDVSAASCSDHTYLANQGDSAVVDQDVRSLQWQQLSSKERDPALRAAQQQAELMEMIRNELALEQELTHQSSFLEQLGVPGEHISPQMRMIVCSWLSEVACEFNMQQETLFLSVALMDRFMGGTKGIPRTVLQLVAVGCMLLASKQDEVVHPSVEELTDIAANCFQVHDLLRMERVLLDGLSWRIKTPTTYTFLHLFTQTTAVLRAAAAQAAAPPACSLQQQQSSPAASSEPMQGSVVAQAAYLTELALLDYSCALFKPSQLAASALLLAQSWSQQGAAAQEMQHVSGYCLGDLQECMTRLLHLHQCAAASASAEALAPFMFVKEKYSQDCWLQASLREVPPAACTAGSIHQEQQ
ncbi:cyclin-like protein [Scenedesmus sp. NREL 46B-D3]|nr:cyclin-like protein [Scenedesmus sp. NREL 46B-D3]